MAATPETLRPICRLAAIWVRSILSLLPAGRALELDQGLALRLRLVVLVQRVASGGKAVTGRRRAVAERAAELFGARDLPAAGQDIRRQGRIGERHPADPNEVRPPLPDRRLRRQRQELLQVGVGRTDEHEIG